MRLKRIEIEGYRCFRRLVLEVPASGLVVLIGPNGVGKTTILDALDLLATAAASEGGLQEAMAVRGSVTEVSTWGSAAPVRFLLTWEHMANVAVDVEYELVIGTVRGFPGPVFEEVRFDTANRARLRPEHQFNNVMLQRDATRDVAWLIRDGISEHTDVSGRGLLLSVSRTDFASSVVGMVKSAVANMGVFGHFSTEPRWFLTQKERYEGARSVAQPVLAEKLDARASNLQSALLTLKSERTVRWNQLIRDFRVAFPWVKHLDFKMAGGQQALAADVDSQAQLRLASEVFSDGMFAWLSMLTAFATAESDGVVAFDEPESGLHPELLRAFVGHAEIHAETFGPVFIATHSDLLLDALEEPSSSVHTMTRTEDGPSLTRLNEAELAVWLKTYRLSELRAKGVLGGKRM